MKSLIWHVFFGIGLAGCTTQPQTVESRRPSVTTKVGLSQIEAERLDSICSIFERPSDYSGKMLEIDAFYVSDHMFYSYLEDPNCHGANAIEVVDPIHGVGDGTVTSFFELEDRACTKRGGQLCPVRIRVFVVALIRPDKKGTLLAELKSVFEHADN